MENDASKSVGATDDSNPTAVDEGYAFDLSPLCFRMLSAGRPYNPAFERDGVAGMK